MKIKCYHLLMKEHYVTYSHCNQLTKSFNIWYRLLHLPEGSSGRAIALPLVWALAWALVLALANVKVLR